MTSDPDPYATAKALLKRHGEAAWFEAAQRADAMLEAGDVKGAATWKRVLAAVRELQKREPGGVVH